MSDAEELERIHAWGRQLVAEKATVMHVQNRFVGRVRCYYDGVIARSEGCHAPVLEFVDGSTLIAEPGRFHQLSEAEVRLYNHLVAVFKAICGGSSIQAINTGIEEEDHRLVVVAALRAQLVALEAGR